MLGLVQIMCSVSTGGNHRDTARGLEMKKEGELEKSLLTNLCTEGPLAARCCVTNREELIVGCLNGRKKPWISIAN